MFFTHEEYVSRWERVSAAMAACGYETLLVWQRSAGTYDRVGNLYWLTNFKTHGTGQDPASEEFGAPYTFSAALVRRGQEPELHIGAPSSTYDRSQFVCGELVCHEGNMMVGLANHLRTQGIEGQVALVGDDVLPGMYDRILRRHTPQIEWVSDDTFLLAPQSIKSPRELEAYRTAGDIVTRALTAAMEAMIAGETAAESAARAAAIIMRDGGGFHRIDISHGPPSERLLLSNELYGYDTTAAAPGEILRTWIYGPIFQGYWMDPGRSAVSANRPTPAQRALLEGAAAIVQGLVEAVAPGKTAREVGLAGAAIARKVGFFDHPQTFGRLFGHGLGTYFVPHIIPVSDEQDAYGMALFQEPFRPGMVVAAEAFLTHPGIGTAGFENNLIVTDNGVELLDRTPMLFW